MASARAIKNRIKSTKNIAQITKAMEAVSAVKMRKSQEVALRSRPYALAALEMLKNLSGGIEIETLTASPLLERRPVKTRALLVVTSDKGLAGAFNGNVLRRAALEISKYQNIEVIAVGKKANDFFKKRNIKISGSFTGIGDWATLDQTRRIAQEIQSAFVAKRFDEVTAVYTNFISVMKQEVIVEQILPFSREEIERRVNDIAPNRGRYAQTPAAFGATKAASGSYLFEPSPAEVLRELMPLLFETMVYHIILEANASEHSARMVAMKSASENASDLIGDLTLTYNKARQAQITKELTEITSGAAALES